MKLNIKVFALTCSLFWGVALFMLTWWIILLDGATGDITFIGRIYRGYDISAMGSLIGLAYALVDGLIGGAIFAWLYNMLLGRATAADS